MKKISFINEEASRLHQDQTFSDLKLDLEKKLMTVRSDLDISDLLSEVNRILQMSELSSRNIAELKNFRQKIYDRKKKPQALVHDNPNEITQERFKNVYKAPEYNFSPEGLSTQPGVQMSISEQILSYLKGIDLESVINKLPAFILFAGCAVVTMWFVWIQSIPLYQSIGFSDPKWVSFGALLMIAGFSLIHAVTRSKLVLLLCLYASSYEVILIVNGTMKNESVVAQSQIEQNPEVVWLKQQAEHSNQSYQTVKAQYENPSSKVFQNNWYKDKFVDVAWQKYSTDQKLLSEKIEKLGSVDSSWDRVGMLKILYRLGLVFLCMISIHHLLKLFVTVKSKPTTSLRPQTLSSC